MKLKIKIWLLLGFLMALVLTVDLIVSYNKLAAEVQVEIEYDAKTVYAFMMATRRIYQKQFIDSGVPLNSKTVGFLPAHSFSRISKDFANWSQSGIIFNNVSDMPRNPGNQADHFELEAMAWFRATPKASERMQQIVDDKGVGYLLFTAPIWVEASCLKCHGSIEEAPPSIRETYPTAYDYKIGDLRGIVSIKMPTAKFDNRRLQMWSGQLVKSLAGYAAIFLVLGFILDRLVTRRLSRLQAGAELIAAGDYGAQIAQDGRDEIAGLARTFNLMANEVQARDQALRQINENLEQRVAAETAKNRDKDHLLIQQSRLAAMGEMIGNIAHQWRQPINALGLLLANIKDAHDFGEMTQEELDRQVETGTRLIQKMSTTIDDFRNFFRPDKEKAPFKLSSTLAEIREILGSSLANHNIALEEDIPRDITVTGYHNEYAQALLNLVNNAKEAILANNVKDGHIRVEIREEAGMAVVRVADNGGGIPEQVLPKIFDPYFTTKSQGTGIGLYMVKAIVETNMGGHIEVRNIADGAQFTVALPLD